MKCDTQILYSLGKDLGYFVMRKKGRKSLKGGTKNCVDFIIFRARSLKLFLRLLIRYKQIQISLLTTIFKYLFVTNCEKLWEMSGFFYSRHVSADVVYNASPTLYTIKCAPPRPVRHVTRILIISSKEDLAPFPVYLELSSLWALRHFPFLLG